jgi:hypothetical protein
MFPSGQILMKLDEKPIIFIVFLMKHTKMTQSSFLLSAGFMVNIGCLSQGPGGGARGFECFSSGCLHIQGVFGGLCLLVLYGSLDQKVFFTVVRELEVI